MTQADRDRAIVTCRPDEHPAQVGAVAGGGGAVKMPQFHW
jgi:hypothetical protein